MRKLKIFCDYEVKTKIFCLFMIFFLLQGLKS